MLNNKIFISIATALACLFTFSPSGAYDLPNVNLGFTSYYDAIPPNGPGFYFTQYLHYIDGRKFTDNNGGRLLPRSAGEKLKGFVAMPQLIYTSPAKPFLNAMPGLDLALPIVFTNLSYHGSGPFPENNSDGIGDLLVGPFLQWDPVMKKDGSPLMCHRVEFQLLFPTGRYSSNKEINPGSNFFSFNPYWSSTWWVTPRWTASLRLHYLWNAKNHDPNRSFGDVGHTQAGQAIHFNYTTAYSIIPKKLHLGINGYFLKQFTDTEVSGHDVSGRREQVFAIGPGGLWSITPKLHMFFNAYFESHVRNRPEGFRNTIRFVYKF